MQSFDLIIILFDSKIDSIESFLFFKKQISFVLILSSLIALLVAYKKAI